MRSGNRELHAPQSASSSTTTSLARLRSRQVAIEGAVHRWLVANSMVVLRVTMGLVFFGFGFLKFFPGASPAQDLAVTTTRILTFGLIPDALALVLVATLECAIGLSLITDIGRRVNVYLLAVELLGILSPVVLLPGRLFPGAEHLPTLEAQYVLKDIVLVGVAMVLATRFRGARIAHPEPVAPAGSSPAGGSTSMIVRDVMSPRLVPFRPGLVGAARR